MTIDWKNALEAELSALRTAAIADAARIAELEASLAALVYLDSELDRAAKRKYDLASIVSRGEQDDEN